MKKLVEQTLKEASEEIGVREVNNNRGKRVEEYLAVTGLGGGYAWCAAFASFCAKEAAKKLNVLCPLVMSADCDVFLAFARKRDILATTPQPGDLFLVMKSNNDANHIGYVTEVNGNSFGTIEGNTNDGGSREGIGVFKRTRTNSPKYRFVRWAALVPESEQPSEPAVKLYTLYLSDDKPSTKDIKVGEMPLVGGMAMCPVRLLATKLGLEVEWDQEDQAIKLGGKSYPGEVSVGEDGVSRVPVRKMADYLGLLVVIDESKKEVRLKRPNPSR